jgi:hypothetical protein
MHWNSRLPQFLVNNIYRAYLLITLILGGICFLPTDYTLQQDYTFLRNLSHQQFRAAFIATCLVQARRNYYSNIHSFHKEFKPSSIIVLFFFIYIKGYRHFKKSYFDGLPGCCV